MSFNQSENSKVPKVAYEALVDFFTRHENEVVEIEVLPPAIQPPDGITLEEGLNLGIPKKILALAFIEARQRFLGNVTSDCTSSTAFQATKVILLFDPEYITAANFRKRRLLALKDGGSETKTIFQVALKQELCFLNSILTSPLHRQSKSPTLWHHRLWLVNLTIDHELSNASDEQKKVFWRDEIDAVCKSGEQHPKNYYAWQYARRFLPHTKDLGLTDEFVHRVKNWCFKHPSDISGWSFLLFQLRDVSSLPNRQPIIQEVFNYAINLRAEQESLWMFIRLSVSQDGYGDRLQNYQTLQKYNEEMDENTRISALSERIHQTLNWTATFGAPILSR